MDERRRPDAGAAPYIQINNSVLTGGTFTVNAARDDDEEVSMRGAMGRKGADGSFRFNAVPHSLQDIVSFDALLNSKERYPAPKCHPDTRKVALQIVRSWIGNRRAGFRRIMWISGAPGVGKSALLQTTCETLAGQIHASFFFGRGQDARELAASLPPTIAYQFTVISLVCRWYTWYLLRNDPAILREAFHSQFRKLVMAPASLRSYLQYPMVVSIDGLDECVDVQDRVSLLELIFEAASTLSIRFLIASRPELEIETFFKRSDVAQHVDHIILDEETFKTSKDIQIFLRSEFTRIRRSRPELTFELIDGKEWPGDAIIDRVTVDSDGQFMFSTLFIGYLDEELFSPQEQLAILLNPPAHVAAFSKLDGLYHQIFTRCPRHIHQEGGRFVQYQKIVKGILRTIIAWPEQLSIAGIAKVLGAEVHVVENAVRGPLRTLFKFEGSGPDSKISFYHKSLGDCLSDPHRSGEFHVPPDALDLLYLNLLHCMLSCPSPANARVPRKGDVIGMLHTIVAWPNCLREGEIASLWGIGSEIVSHAVDPCMGLLFGRTEWKRGIVIRLDSFKDFLMDPTRSGEFHAPPNALDLLYLHILSRPPPSDPAQTFSREQLVGVLNVVVVALPEHMSEDEIAAVLGLDSDAVKRVVAAFNGSLFRITELDKKTIKPRWGSFRNFLMDPQRSAEFHVPPNALDVLFHRILTHPPPSDPGRTFSREQLVGVLHVLATWPFLFGEDQIASFLGLDSHTVDRVVAHFDVMPFRRVEEERIVIWKFFKDFLLDPQRSREFHVQPNALDVLFHRILTRPPPSDPGRTFSREQLVGVLHVLVTWSSLSGEDQSASFLGWDSDTVGRVVAHFEGVLFRRVKEERIVIWKVFEDFLLDRRRSGEFHVQPNPFDLLLHRILAHPLPSGHIQSSSRERLVKVLHVLVAHPSLSGEDQIATFLGLDSDTVGRVVAHFEGVLFRREERIVIRKVFEDLLLGRQRSREFHVQPNPFYLLLHRIFTPPLPSDPAASFFREQLAEVLQLLNAHTFLSEEDQIASFLGLGSGTVGRVVAHFEAMLFRRVEKERIVIWKFFEDFLLDPQRSGEFRVQPNPLDLLLHRILGHPLPSDPAQSFSREQLVGVFHVLVAHPFSSGEDQIASFPGLGSDTVGRVVTHFEGVLFRRVEEERIVIWKAFEDFLLDPQRSGEFHVQPNALDLLLIYRIRSLPPRSALS